MAPSRRNRTIVAATAGVVAATGATHAEATIADTNGATIGWARFTEDAAGRLHVSVQVAGISPGRHGIHLHAIGSCVGPTFATAGGHHNPLGAQHGWRGDQGSRARQKESAVHGIDHVILLRRFKAGGFDSFDDQCDKSGLHARQPEKQAIPIT